jgi:hypothetical protein
MLDSVNLRGRVFRDGQWIWSSSRGGAIVIASGAVEVVASGGPDLSLLLGVFDAPLSFQAEVHTMELKIRALGLCSAVAIDDRVKVWRPTSKDMLSMAEFASLRAEQRIERLCELYLRGRPEGLLPRRTQSDMALASGLTLRTVTRVFKDLQARGQIELQAAGWYFRAAGERFSAPQAEAAHLGSSSGMGGG